MTITVSITLYQKMTYSLAFRFSSHFLVYKPQNLVNPIVDISEAVVPRCSVEKLF